jgi:AraC-like DNA-binding protein
MPWRGNIAFEDEALAFRGESAENRFHAHAAVQCVHAAAGVRIHDRQGHVFEGPGWLVRSGVPHFLEPAVALTLVLIEPQSRLAAGVLQQVGDQPISGLPAAFGTLFEPSKPLAPALAEFKRQAMGPGPAVDRRVLAALDQLDIVATRDAAAVAAARAGISASHLRALCQAQLGVPFVKLMLWRKVRRACMAMNAGLGLAQAALVAGFADQAHLTRTMAEVIGLTPSVAARTGA